MSREVARGGQGDSKYAVQIERREARYGTGVPEP